MVFEYFSDIYIELFLGIITLLFGIITVVILLAEFDISQLPIIYIRKTEIQLKLNPITKKDEKWVNMEYGILLVKHGRNPDFSR